MIENGMGAGYHPPAAPPPECEICGDAPYKTHGGKLLCYHHWCNAISATADPYETLLYTQQNRPEFCEYLEKAIKGSALNWNEFIYNAWLDRCKQNDVYKSFLDDYINDCDRSDLAAQIEKWKKL